MRDIPASYHQPNVEATGGVACRAATMALTRNGPQQPTYPLDVLPLAGAPRHDNRHLGVGSVEGLVQHPSRDECSKLPLPEAGNRVSPLRRSDVARQGHDQML